MTNDTNALAGTTSNKVVVTDIQMPFASMVGFMIKWAIATVPAALILIFLGAVTFAFLSGFTRALFH